MSVRSLRKASISFTSPLIAFGALTSDRIRFILCMVLLTAPMMAKTPVTPEMGSMVHDESLRRVD